MASWWSRLWRRGVVVPEDLRLGQLQTEPYFRAPGTWTMQSVESALDAHERGDFRESGRLVDALLADETVASLLALRTGTVTGLPFHFSPDQPQSIMDDWEYIFPVEAQDEVLMRTLMMGFCWVQDERQSYDDLSRWCPWPPDGVCYDTWRRVWRVDTVRGPVDLQENDARWAIFASRRSRPWLAGYIRAIAPMVIIRQSTLFNWANHAQVYATPSRLLKATRQTAEMEDVQRAVALLRKLVGDSTIVLPEGLDLALLELKEITYEIYLKLREEIDKALQILLVGQLGTAKAAGGWGSAHTERRVTQQLLERDVKILQGPCWRQMMVPYAAWKWGTRKLSLVPRPIWDATPPADLAAEADREAKQAQARYQISMEIAQLAKLRTPDNRGVDIEALCKQRGLPMRDLPPLPPVAPPALPPKEPTP